MLVVGLFFVLKLVCFGRVRMQCQNGKHESLHLVVNMRLKGCRARKGNFWMWLLGATFLSEK